MLAYRCVCMLSQLTYIIHVHLDLVFYLKRTFVTQEVVSYNKVSLIIYKTWLFV